MAWWGAVCGVQGAVAPFLAESFALSDPEIARALGWVGCSALGALALGRLVDRLGRRRVLLACLAGLPAGALATAAAPTMELYVAVQIGVYALGTTLLSTVSVAHFLLVPITSASFSSVKSENGRFTAPAM